MQSQLLRAIASQRKARVIEIVDGVHRRVRGVAVVCIPPRGHLLLLRQVLAWNQRLLKCESRLKL